MRFVYVSALLMKVSAFLAVSVLVIGCGNDQSDRGDTAIKTPEKQGKIPQAPRDEGSGKKHDTQGKQDKRDKDNRTRGLLAAINQNRQETIAGLRKLGCKVEEDLKIECPFIQWTDKEPDDMDDYERLARMTANIATLSHIQEQEEGLYKNLHLSDQARQDALFVQRLNLIGPSMSASTRCTIAFSKLADNQRRQILDDSELHGIYVEDDLKPFDKQEPCATGSVKNVMEGLRKFKNLVDVLKRHEKELNARAYDRVIINQEVSAKYGDDAYDYFGLESNGLNVKVAIDATEPQIVQLIQSLDPLHNDRYKRREEVKSRLLEAERFVKRGSPFSIRFDVDWDVNRDQKLDDLMSAFDALMNEASAALSVANIHYNKPDVALRYDLDSPQKIVVRIGHGDSAACENTKLQPNTFVLTRSLREKNESPTILECVQKIAGMKRK